jgi:hypothetical protein
MTIDEPNVSEDELESASGEPLPDREAMSLLPLDPLGGPQPLSAPVEPEVESSGGEHTLPVEPPAES